MLLNIHNIQSKCQLFLLIFKLNNHTKVIMYYNRIINILNNYKFKNNHKYHNIVTKVKEKRELKRQ